MRQRYTLSVWVDRQGSRGLAGDGPEKEILEELRRRGLEVHPLTPFETPEGPVLVLFERCTPDLALRVREWSRQGQERLVAVSQGRDALAQGAGWRLLEAGASDVFSAAGAAETASILAARFGRWDEVDRLVASPAVARTLVGQSAVWRSTLRQIVEVARFSRSSVLLGGESGTGKELVARLIHDLDPRGDRRELVVLDCTTVVPELSGSELFGHERGAFTGAVAARDGAFALADRGTLFADEIGDLRLRLQAELLRAVQEGTYKRVGSNAWQRTSFRLISATHRDLLQEVDEGRFRRDLYYRIAGWTCRLPPLRERREDIPLLVRHFLAERYGPGEVPEVDPAVLGLLLARDYPGNVRDLRQLVHRIAHRHVGSGPITLGDVPVEERVRERRGEEMGAAGFEAVVRLALAQGLGLREIGRLAAETAVRIALEEEGGCLRHAAERLGVTNRALQLRRAGRVSNR